MVGLGWWGARWSPCCKAAGEHLDVVVAVEPDPSAKDFAEAQRYGASRPDFDEALARDRTSRRSSSPRRIRCTTEQIEKAVAAGKHVFCEKPLAMTKAGAEKAVALCRDAGLVLGMGHERRFEPPIAEMLASRGARQARPHPARSRRTSATTSSCRSTETNWRLKAAQAPAGGMTATGIHLHRPVGASCSGRPATSASHCENLASEMPQGDTMSALHPLRGRRHRLCLRDARHPLHVALRGLRNQGLDRNPRQGACRIAGRLGRDLGLDRHADHDARGRRRPSRCGTTSSPSPGAVRGDGTYPITGEDMINNIALLEAIVASAETGRSNRSPERRATEGTDGCEPWSSRHPTSRSIIDKPMPEIGDTKCW